MMKYHMMAFVTGFILDLIFGDPYWLPHPIRLIGNTISRLEKKLYKETNQFLRGAILAISVMILTVFASGIVLFAGYKIHPFLGLVIESIMTYQILAMTCLKVESMKVYDKLKSLCLCRPALPSAGSFISSLEQMPEKCRTHIYLRSAGKCSL